MIDLQTISNNPEELEKYSAYELLSHDFLKSVNALTDMSERTRICVRIVASIRGIKRLPAAAVTRQWWEVLTMANKHLHAVMFDGTTFGMEIEANTQAYRSFKKSIKQEKAVGVYDSPINIMTVPYLSLAAIMREAHQSVLIEAVDRSGRPVEHWADVKSIEEVKEQEE